MLQKVVNTTRGNFFTRWWEPEKWFWWFEPFSKLKASFCEYWTSIKIKISTTWVSKEYEIKTKMVQESLQLKMKFFLGLELENFYLVAAGEGGEIDFWRGENKNLLGGGRNTYIYIYTYIHLYIIYIYILYICTYAYIKFITSCLIRSNDGRSISRNSPIKHTCSWRDKFIAYIYIYIYIYVKTYIVFIKVYITVKCFMLKCFQEKSFFTFTITIDR